MEIIAWTTDLHLDSAEPVVIRTLYARVRASGARALLVGGDIATARNLERRLRDLADAVGMPVHFVLGNHDYYGGSIAEVRARIGRLDRPGLHWLPATGPQELAPGVVLAGHGGWGDARNGDFAGSDAVLTDYLRIAELRHVFDLERFTGTFGKDSPLEAELRRLGQDAADTLAPHLAAAAATSPQVIVLTHVPPFRDACWHEGRVTSDHWLPGFSCGATGDLLLAVARAHPACRFTVLCGHTHSAATARPAPNLIVHAQTAEYGSPGFVLLGVDGDAITLPG
ncbi:MAG: metallophosphoesterase [bacterium]|nr:metallophosphoesterase [bacterium]